MTSRDFPPLPPGLNKFLGFGWYFWCEEGVSQLFPGSDIFSRYYTEAVFTTTLSISLDLYPQTSLEPAFLYLANNNNHSPAIQHQAPQLQRPNSPPKTARAPVA